MIIPMITFSQITEQIEDLKNNQDLRTVFINTIGEGIIVPMKQILEIINQNPHVRPNSEEKLIWLCAIYLSQIYDEIYEIVIIRNV